MITVYYIRIFHRDIYKCIMFRDKYTHQRNIKNNMKSDFHITVLDSYDFP